MYNREKLRDILTLHLSNNSEECYGHTRRIVDYIISLLTVDQLVRTLVKCGYDEEELGV